MPAYPGIAAPLTDRQLVERRWTRSRKLALVVAIWVVSSALWYVDPGLPAGVVVVLGYLIAVPLGICGGCRFREGRERNAGRLLWIPYLYWLGALLVGFIAAGLSVDDTRPAFVGVGVFAVMATFVFGFFLIMPLMLGFGVGVVFGPRRRTTIPQSLRSTDLHAADLRNADLIGVDLSDAILLKTNLCGADLRGADLSGALLDGARLYDALYDEATRWPEGFDPEAAGAVLVD